MAVVSRLLSQPAARGSLPQLYAATAPGVRGGQFFGPSGFQEMRGGVTDVQPVLQARDTDTAERLWALSEALTGVVFPLQAGAETARVIPSRP